MALTTALFAGHTETDRTAVPPHRCLTESRLTRWSRTKGGGGNVWQAVRRWSCRPQRRPQPPV